MHVMYSTRQAALARVDYRRKQVQGQIADYLYNVIRLLM